jgi:hypothetical protein
MEIENNFKWKRVYNVMKLLDWDWHFGDDQFGIPRIGTIKKHARERCLQAYITGYSCTGGFLAEFKNNQLTLSFILEDWTA